MKRLLAPLPLLAATLLIGCQSISASRITEQTKADGTRSRTETRGSVLSVRENAVAQAGDVISWIGEKAATPLGYILGGSGLTGVLAAFLKWRMDKNWEDGHKHGKEQAPPNIIIQQGGPNQ